MYKELTAKIRISLKEQWFYHMIVGIFFLLYTAIVILGNGIFLDNIIKILGFLFLLTGIGNLIYSFSGIGEREFHWGEIFFWGLFEVFSGWVLLSNKILEIEQELIEEVSLVVEKVVASKIELRGYLVMFYIGTFLTFRGINHIVMTIYNNEGILQNKTLVMVKRILVFDGFVDLIFGIVVTLMMYLNQSSFPYVIFIYVFITSITTILFSFASKYSIKIEKDISIEKETT
ncbi:hypothetical protein [Cetobacterium sp.]|uniref:hypothetical protein n=1 Tax=Cetobacterium sp. TaxID=2071632 RepID=UPI003F300E57